MRPNSSTMRPTTRMSTTTAKDGVSRMMRPTGYSLVSLLVIFGTLAQLCEAYPSSMIVFHHPSVYTSSQAENAVGGHNRGVSKRAFDRLDMSPFDFEALSKRFNDDEDYYRKKKAFDRLDENGFFGMLRKRRAFDRLDDNSFMLGRKRRSFPASWPLDQAEGNQVLVAKRPFDRVDASAFGMSKKSEHRGQKGPSIAQWLEQFPEYFQQPETGDQSN